MENHKPLRLPNKFSKRNLLRSRKPVGNYNASRSSQNRQIRGAKISSKSKVVQYAQPGGSRKRNKPGRCRSPPYSQEDCNIMQDNQGEHFSDFEIIVKDEVQEEKDVILVTIKEEEVSKNISPVAGQRHRNRKRSTCHPICFIECQTANIPRLRRMELKVKELILAVKSHPELWNPSDRGYSDRQKKTAAWSSVCHHLYPEWDGLDNRDRGILDSDVRKRWRSARDQFRREIVQREAQNGSAPPSKKPYIYLEELMFLMPVLDLRPANINGADADVLATQYYQLGESELEIPAITPEEGASESSDGGRSMGYDEPPTTSTATSVFHQVLPLQLRRTKDKKASCHSASADTIDSQVLAYLQRNIEDSEDAFVRSLGNYIRKVPERWRLWLRSGIQTLIEAFIPPNDPEKVLGLLDQIKLVHPSITAPPMDIESMTSLAGYSLSNQPYYGLSGSPQPTPQSLPCSSHSFPRLSSYHSHPSTNGDSPSQPSYAFHSHQEPRSHASFPSSPSLSSPLSSSNIPSSSSSSSHRTHMSTSPSYLTACASISTSPPTHSSYTTSWPQLQ